jgi:hypothetical protein
MERLSEVPAPGGDEILFQQSAYIITCASTKLTIIMHLERYDTWLPAVAVQWVLYPSWFGESRDRK